MGDFGNETPTHMGTTHAISKIEQKFQNRIPRELDKNFNIPRISLINWISSNFLKRKKRLHKKAYTEIEKMSNFRNLFCTVAMTFYLVELYGIPMYTRIDVFVYSRIVFLGIWSGHLM